ncbi:MAG: TonB-dependent receptor plug domain-containing protein, partial [Myxococcota bacterium]
MLLVNLVLSTSLASEPEEPVAIPELIVTASRASGTTGPMPVSGATLDYDDIADGRPTIELGEALSQVPGVFVSNRTNFAQDSRIAIRGFGARAAFGVRGIRVLLDGIPLTLPDGKSQIDSIDMANLGRLEVLRGPSGSAYGNASGGVLTLTTRRAEGEGIEVDADTTLGSFGLWKTTAAVRSSTEQTDVSLFASRTQLAGWREQSGTEQVVAQAHVATWLAPALRWTTNVHFVDAPVADDPGGLTPEDAENDPRAASEVNRTSGTGEALSHLQAGTRLVGTIGSDHQIEVVAHAGLRAFDAAIPFRTIQFDRDFYGGLATWRWSTRPAPVQSQLVVGVEAQGQDDDRRNEGNDAGRPDGTISLSQQERATSLGAFVQERLSFDERAVLLGAVRYDRVAFRLEDRLLE